MWKIEDPLNIEYPLQFLNKNNFLKNQFGFLNGKLTDALFLSNQFMHDKLDNALRF